MASVIGKSSGYLWRSAGKYYLLSFAVVLLVLAGMVGALKLMTLAAASGSIGLVIGLLVLVKTLDIVFGKTPKRLERTGDRYLRGRKGEVECGHILAKLPDSYTVFKDVTIDKYGNIDYVVVGPNGVWAVEVKNHGGRVGFDGRAMTLNGKPFRDKDILRQANDEAMRLKRLLEPVLGHRLYVGAILAFTNRRVSLGVGTEPIRNVLVIRVDTLNQAIVTSRGFLKSGEAELVCGLLRKKVRL